MTPVKICGLDEAGRGCLAGPLVAAAVVPTIRVRAEDSKKLNAAQRNKIYRRLIKTGAEIVVESVSAAQINNRGMGWANKEVFRRLIRKIEADKYIVDGNLNLGRIMRKTDKVMSMVDADEKIVEVSMASIAAKVTRDKMMRELDREHPKYGWKVNKGYGTARHIAAIRKYGVVRYHRSVFVTTALRGKMD